MKKRHFVLGAFLAMTSLFTLASCGDDDKSKAVLDYNENELTQKVYDEYAKTVTNANYNDFLSNVIKQDLGEYLAYNYGKSTIKIDKKGTFISKDIEVTDSDGYNIGIVAYVKNNEWKTSSEIVYENDSIIHRSYMYNTDLNGNWIYKEKKETTYKNGDKISDAEFLYYEYDWYKTYEKIYLNDESYIVYILKPDGSMKKIEKQVNDNIKTTIYSKSELNYKTKEEYVYDEKQNRIGENYYEYVNNDWYTVKRIEYSTDIQFNGYREYLYENNKLYNISLYQKSSVASPQNYRKVEEISVDSDGTYKTKVEKKYDFYDNVTETKNYIYENGEWVLVN
jgi:hypothetical protein